MTDYNIDLQTDIEIINRISIVPSLLDVICRTTGMGFAAIARVTEDRWVACSVLDTLSFGLQPGSELEIQTTFCNQVRRTGEIVMIDYVAEDKDYYDHAIPRMYGFQSYISVPIYKKDGSFFGTLCSLDTEPASVKTPHNVEMFKLFADLISFHMEAVEQLEDTQAKLTEEQKTAVLREQFIAILGHDLKNPVSAMMNTAELMLRMPLDSGVSRLAKNIKTSSYRVMGLIENVLDFARGRLGDGIHLNYKTSDTLQQTLSDIIAETKAMWPDRSIKTHFNIHTAVTCDESRIAQLFSNLLTNAIKHGSMDTPIIVQAVCSDGQFQLSVGNIGEPIPEATQKQLFQPFFRGGDKSSKRGLGLGLYICSQIATAHEGTLAVTSNSDETIFTFQMPLR